MDNSLSLRHARILLKFMKGMNVMNVMVYCPYHLVDEVVSTCPAIVRKGIKKVRYSDNDGSMLKELIEKLGGENNVAFLKVVDMDFDRKNSNVVNMKFVYISECDFQYASQIRTHQLYADDDDY